MSLPSTCVVWMVFATAEAATREARANVVMRVFMEVSFAKRCQVDCRDIRKIIRWPAGAIKLPFRKLNSILCEQVGRAAGAAIAGNDDGVPQRP